MGLGISIRSPPLLKNAQWRKRLTVTTKMIQVCMSSPVSYDLQGQGGGVVIDDTNLHTGNFRWIQVIVDCEINTIVSSNISNAAGFAALTVPAGVGIGGMFTSIALDTGVVIAYYA